MKHLFYLKFTLLFVSIHVYESAEGKSTEVQEQETGTRILTFLLNYKCTTELSLWTQMSLDSDEYMDICPDWCWTA